MFNHYVGYTRNKGSMRIGQYFWHVKCSGSRTTFMGAPRNRALLAKRDALQAQGAYDHISPEERKEMGDLDPDYRYFR